MIEFKEMEALVVEKDELLVIRVDDDFMEEDSNITDLQDFLNRGPMKDRYIIFCGKVEFTKVKV